jgi:hypothetical protein
MSEFSKEKQAKPEVKAESPKAKKVEQKDPAKTPANESQVSARAAAISRSLKKNEGLPKVAAKPDPSAVSRGALIADKFMARAAQRNS